MADEADTGFGCEVDVLEVSGELDSQALTHGLDIVIRTSLVGTADEDFYLEANL